jgi:hypothetical protein
VAFCRDFDFCIATIEEYIKIIDTSIHKRYLLFSVLSKHEISSEKNKPFSGKVREKNKELLRVY